MSVANELSGDYGANSVLYSFTTMTLDMSFLVLFFVQKFTL